MVNVSSSKLYVEKSPVFIECILDLLEVEPETYPMLKTEPKQYIFSVQEGFSRYTKKLTNFSLDVIKPEKIDKKSLVYITENSENTECKKFKENNCNGELKKHTLGIRYKGSIEGILEVQFILADINQVVEGGELTPLLVRRSGYKDNSKNPVSPICIDYRKNYDLFLKDALEDVLKEKIV